MLTTGDGAPETFHNDKIKVARALLEILPSGVKIRQDTFRNWHKFAKALYARGGIIEAHVEHHTGSPTVNLSLEPSGQINVISTHEQIFCPARNRIGSSMPATSAPSDLVFAAAEAIGQTCWAAGELPPGSAATRELMVLFLSLSCGPASADHCMNRDQSGLHCNIWRQRCLSQAASASAAGRAVPGQPEDVA